MRKFILLPCVFFMLTCSPAQNIFISRFIPGKYLVNNLHRIDIFNPSSYPRNVSGYLLVTRNYSLRIPRGSIIPAHSGLSFARFNTASQQVDIQLSRAPDFLIRFPDPSLPGNYVILFDRNMNRVDGMYFSPQLNVAFLPDEGNSITFRGDTIPFRIPDESDKFWDGKRISLVEDPAVGFIQVSGNWIPTGIRTNLLPATSFKTPLASWFDGIVRIDFSSRFEENCFYHLIERSPDGQNFTTIGKLDAKGTAARGGEYAYYDPGTETGKTWYYRIRNRDIYGNDVYSQVVSVFSGEVASDFSINVFMGKSGATEDISIRFLSKITRPVRLSLLNENFRVEEELFSGTVESDRQNLVKIPGGLPPSKYILVAETESKRYFREISVE